MKLRPLVLLLFSAVLVLTACRQLTPEQKRERAIHQAEEEARKDREDYAYFLDVYAHDLDLTVSTLSPEQLATGRQLYERKFSRKPNP